MADINHTLSVVVLHVNGLKAPIKRQILAERIKKMIKLCAIHKRHTLDSKTQIS